jgi:5-deoxy-5-amino-3-dehydroquinate synthase
LSGRQRIPVRLGERSYEVVVGPGAAGELASVLAGRARRAAVVTQEAVGVEVDPGVEGRRFLVPDGEAAKSLATLEGLCRRFAAWGLTRADAVVAVGGGVVSDLAGFAAAVYHRGTPWVAVPTTLLAQVDAAVGGKTGVDLPEGKNLVGAFWQPAAVLCDTDVLASLPEREWRCGLGEVAKYSLMGDQDLVGLATEECVARCVRVKAAVVEADEREGLGARAGRTVLNYGHTLAHALEAVGFDPSSGLDLRHGEAVAIGLVFAARLARRLGRVGDAEVQRHLGVVGALGLPTALPPGVGAQELVSRMQGDKKATDGLSFVLKGPRGLELVRGVDPAVVEATLAEMGTA